MRRFPLSRFDVIFRFKRGGSHRAVCMTLRRFSSFFIAASQAKSPFGLYMGVVVWRNILFRRASYIVSDGMPATTGTNIRRMYIVAKMYVFKLFEALVNSKYGFYPLVYFFKPISGCFNSFKFFVFNHVRVFFLLFDQIREDSNAFFKEKQ